MKRMFNPITLIDRRAFWTWEISRHFLGTWQITPLLMTLRNPQAVTSISRLTRVFWKV
jgi:hypothetical protein